MTGQTRVKSFYLNLSIPMKSALWLTFSVMLQKGISVLTVPLFTRLLNESAYGTVSIFNAWANIINLFTSLSIYGGVFNTAMLKYEDHRDEVLSSFLGLTNTITIIFFVCFLIFKESLLKIIGLPTVFVYIIFIQCLIAPAFNLWMAKSRYEYRYKSVVLISLSMSVLGPLFSCVAVIQLSHKAFARIIAVETVNNLFYLAIFIFVMIKGKKFFDLTYWKYALSINVPLIPHFLSETILNQSDRIMINNFCGPGSAGIYSVAYTYSTLLTIANGSINSSLIPWMYHKIQCKELDVVRHVISHIIIAITTIAIVFILSAPEIMKIFASRQYYEAIWIVPPVTAGIVFWYIYLLFTNIELYYERSAYITVAAVCSAILNISLNFIFIPTIGYLAAGYTTLASYILCAMIHYHFVHKIILKESWKISIFDKRVFASCAVASTFIVLLAPILYRNCFLRYIIFGIILIFCGFLISFFVRFYKH